jgi:hypothetical protein
MPDERVRQIAICDASGFKCYADELVRQWDGAMVLPRFLDKRNPQDFVRGIPDNRAVRMARPEQADTFITGTITPADL